MKAVGHEVLCRAVEKLGAAPVAAKLEISPASLEKLLSGEKPLTDGMLLRVIDLVMDREPDH